MRKIIPLYRRTILAVPVGLGLLAEIERQAIEHDMPAEDWAARQLALAMALRPPQPGEQATLIVEPSKGHCWTYE